MTPEIEILDQGQESMKDERDIFSKAIVLWQERPDAAKLAKNRLTNEGYDPEAIEAVYAIKRIFNLQEQLDRAATASGEMRGSLTGLFEDLTECQFLITHYLLTRADRPDILNEFWRVFKLGTPDTRQANLRRRGLISQVAAHQVLQKLGLKPSLATPRQDAFSAIDMWEGENNAFQVTSAGEPALLDVDHTTLVSSSVDQDAHENRFSSSDAYLESKGRKFFLKLSLLQRPGGPALRGHMMVLPSQSIDQVTGEPSAELIEFFRQKLGK